MNILVLYGTETGNAEECSTAVAEILGKHADVAEFDMTDFTTDRFVDAAADYVVFVTATHGDGELAGGGAAFFEALTTRKPVLTGTKFAVFGLGDSYYTTYNRAGEIVVETMTGFGAELIAPLARHDASSGDDPQEQASEWAQELVHVIGAPVPS
ncbi:nitric oxide synthase [Rhodococcus sp. Eu-32]|uniref:flavodoxin domain-containing protein n=1 Tax=Rhodococcus sp. Eu-32 TaxID=1017319 RepID=UPI000DF3D0EB|nr:flavodoxin domain-containing protein [Rhodococcus sp. Eu-32]RRQ25610.1 nitric oxide synthase [Rhodococcus sp. Eu-32]